MSSHHRKDHKEWQDSDPSQPSRMCTEHMVQRARPGCIVLECKRCKLSVDHSRGLWYQHCSLCTSDQSWLSVAPQFDPKCRMQTTDCIPADSCQLGSIQTSMQHIADHSRRLVLHFGSFQGRSWCKTSMLLGSIGFGMSPSRTTDMWHHLSASHS